MRFRPPHPSRSRTSSESSAPGDSGRPTTPWRERIHEVIFEADTPGGKFFDVGLMALILLSVLIVSLESVEGIAESRSWIGGFTWGQVFLVLEWFSTIVFTVEYIARLVAVRRPIIYARSFFGIVDLLAILPTYLTLFLNSQAQSLLVIRILRLLRIFRVLKLGHLVHEGAELRQAFWMARGKVVVFITTVLSLVAILGASMYLIESGEDSGFTSIPQSMYWAIVTMTTVGYGDIAPVTAGGKMMATVIMLVGYSLIIVPTGIITAELSAKRDRPINTQHCPGCGLGDHDSDASFCKNCGNGL